ncbi:MAG TPA: hypothetical protein VNZ58_11600 [Thermomicrobiales bacterium]|nr:hypothetical protein [Thermomicrobiales bacterium]
MSDPLNLSVFLGIIILRLIMPLFIPRWPLPAIIAALVIDGIDGGVLERFTTLPLDNYQSYDKALDIYYLVIAYLATMRNWTNRDAFVVSRFLIYYRLVGVVLFEWTHARWLLFVFPNTFEYFFIFYEVVRLRWNPARMSRRLVYGAAAAIWIAIKLPQEYWIHVAQLDATDTLATYPVLIVILAVVTIALLILLRWLMISKWPPADHPISFDTGHPIPEGEITTILRQYRSLSWRLQQLPEKIVLVTLVSLIFSQILPNTRLSTLEMTLGVIVVIVANTLVTEWVSGRFSIWWGAVGQFLTMAVINLGLALILNVLTPSRDEPLVFGNVVFFLYLISLLITLFDLFLAIYKAREDGVA